MKKLTSKIIRILCIVSNVVIVPVAILEIYEIISSTAAVDPHLRNMTDGIFWSLFAISQLRYWYVCKQKSKNATL